MRPVVKPERVRRLGSVETGALRRQVARLSDKAWAREDALKVNDYFCFHHTRHIVFRFIWGNHDPRYFYSTVAWRVWRRLLLPVMEQAAAPCGLQRPVYPKAMLARLAAGRGIELHHDGDGGVGGGASNPLVHKIHVPLQTNPEAVLNVDGADFHLEAGQAWEVNNLVAHGAFNGGDEDRIHFIFEVYDAAGTDREPA